MAILPGFRPSFRREATDDVSSATAMNDIPSKNSLGEPSIKHPAQISINESAQSSCSDPSPELPTSDAQRGVQDVEAVTLTWSKQSLILLFILCVLG